MSQYSSLTSISSFDSANSANSMNETQRIELSNNVYEFLESYCDMHPVLMYTIYDDGTSWILSPDHQLKVMKDFPNKSSYGKSSFVLEGSSHLIKIIMEQLFEYWDFEIPHKVDNSVIMAPLRTKGENAENPIDLITVNQVSEDSSNCSDEEVDELSFGTIDEISFGSFEVQEDWSRRLSALTIPKCSVDHLPLLILPLLLPLLLLLMSLSSI